MKNRIKVVFVVLLLGLLMPLVTAFAEVELYEETPGDLPEVLLYGSELQVDEYDDSAEQFMVTEADVSEIKEDIPMNRLMPLSAPAPNITVSTHAGLVSAINNPSNQVIALGSSFSGGNAIAINRSVTLVSAGNSQHTWQQPANGQRHFVVNANGHLTLHNVTLDGAFIEGGTGSNRGGILVQSGGRLTLEQGSRLSRNRWQGQGAGVHITNGTVEMRQGAALWGNMGYASGSTTFAGGVMVNGANSIFIMNGGIIQQNGTNGSGTSTNTRAYAGGVAVAAQGRFTMNGGYIHANGAQRRGGTNRTAGGVAVTGVGSIFTMSGGTILENFDFGNASGSRVTGGVLVRSGGRFEMTGGVIERNQAQGQGDHYAGGVSVWDSNSVFNMRGGFIRENKTIGSRTSGTHNQAGGVLAASGGRFDLFDGTISSNTPGVVTTTGANNQGGGVLLIGSSSLFLMRGGNISDHTIPADSTTTGTNRQGGGVLAMSGRFIMTDGVIERNATNNGDDGGDNIRSENAASVNINYGIIRNNSAR